MDTEIHLAALGGGEPAVPDTDCVDTQLVAGSVLQWLSDNRIHHTVFARTVLSWTTAFSPLLRRPVAWQRADSRTRLAYRAMADWLQLPHQQRLLSLRRKQERVNRKRRSGGGGSGDVTPPPPSAAAGVVVAGGGETVFAGGAGVSSGGDAEMTPPLDCDTPLSTDTGVSSPDSDVGCGGGLAPPLTSNAPARRSRILLTPLQRRALVDIFMVTARPSTAIRRQIAQVLQLPAKTVANFFTTARNRGLPPGCAPSPTPVATTATLSHQQQQLHHHQQQQQHHQHQLNHQQQQLHDELQLQLGAHQLQLQPEQLGLMSAMAVSAAPPGALMTALTADGPV